MMNNLNSINGTLFNRKTLYIAELPYGEEVILTALNEQPLLTLKQLANSFGVSDMLSQKKDAMFIILWLYFFGILTLNGEVEIPS